jgi:hypothetical protein
MKKQRNRHKWNVQRLFYPALLESYEENLSVKMENKIQLFREYVVKKENDVIYGFYSNGKPDAEFFAYLSHREPFGERNGLTLPAFGQLLVT